MKTAIIIHQSKKGTTSRFGEEIGSFLETLGVQSEIRPLSNCQIKELSQYDYLFLGCWTKGLMIVGQHPDKEWKNWVKSLKIPATCKVGLFTAYKIATGRMFSRMQKNLVQDNQKEILKLKSKDGRLSDSMTWRIDHFISSAS